MLTAFPKELVAAIAGLALLGTIAGALTAALQHEPHREAAIVTFGGLDLAFINAGVECIAAPIAEFAEAGTRIYLCDEVGVQKTMTMDELLPFSFKTDMLG